MTEPVCNNIMPDDETAQFMLGEAGFKILSFVDGSSKYELLSEKKGKYEL